MAAIWTTEGDAILHRVAHRDFQVFMKCRSRNAVFLVMSTQNLGTLFATGLIGYLFHLDGLTREKILAIHDNPHCRRGHIWRLPFGGLLSPVKRGNEIACDRHRVAVWFSEIDLNLPAVLLLDDQGLCP